MSTSDRTTSERLHDYSSTPAGLAAPAFDDNAKRVLKERYLAKKPDGTTESETEFLWRVASSVARAERAYGDAATADERQRQTAHVFYDLMARRDFLPNTPCLINAGRPLGMLSACFVLDVPDSIDGIFESIAAQAKIQKSGGGTGMAFSRLRESGAAVVSTGKESSGPVSFMKVFDAATDSIKQGGVRRGANMGVLRVDHPDVLAFMRCKKDLDNENRALWNRWSDSGKYSDGQLAHMKQELLQTQFPNFNISIGITDEFMTAVKNDAPFDLRSPNTGAVVETVQARYLWDNLVEGAWQNGEPGVIFLDHPQANPLPGLGPIEATNPCVTADTWVTTSQGARQVADLIGRPFEALVDGTAYRSSDAGFFLTGVKPVFEVTTSRGFSLKATSDHKVLCLDARGERYWKTVGSLTTDDDIVVHEHRALTWGGRGSFDEGRRIGSLLAGDDRARTDGYRTLGISGPRTASRFAAAERGGRSNNRRDARGTSLAERGAEPTTSADLANLAASFGLHAPETEISAAVEAGSSLFTAGVLRSLFDADGRVHGTADDGVSVRLSSTKVSNLEAVQRMLARLGIISTIVPNRPSGADACHAAHELQVSDAGLEIFAERIGIADADADALLQQGLSAHGRARTASTFAARVLSVNALGEAPVFDCQIAQAHAFDANGLYVHNCGEQLLHGGDSCNLGSINVGNFYDAATNDVAWDRLRAATRIAITFLDDVIDENVYSLPKIAEMVHNNRRVGLGIMGFAELIAHLQIEYGSADCIAFASKLMKCIKDAAEEATIALGAARGDFPNKHLSVFADDARPRRNVALLSIAPTGTISMLAGCAFGCEPYFAMAYTKNVMKDAEGRPQKLYYKVPLFEEIARREGFYSDALLEQVENNGGSVKGLTAVPAAWQRAFTVTADVSVEAHIDMLAAFQEHVCNAVSKTINAPNADTKDSTSRAILRAYEKGCKGFTYYRDGSRTEQVVDIGVKASGTTTDASASPETATPDASSDIESILAKANALLEVPTS